MSSRRDKGVQLSSTAWIRPAAHHPGLVHLRLLDDSIVPVATDVHEWIERVRAGGATTIRTSALFPRAAERFRDAGFGVADTLALLRAELDDPVVRRAVAAPTRPGTGSLRGNEFGAAAAVDCDAFGADWGHDARELAQICDATPHAQVRGRFRRHGLRARTLLAVAIAGASTDHGYLQRLSVDPGAQRAGHGRELTLDALRWMRRRRLQDCLVNTSVDNERALALYTSVGFRRLPEHLEVLELDVRAIH